MADFLALLASKVLVCDGAMTTMLHAAGASPACCIPELNVTRPEIVRAVHRAYISAGVDIIQTNSFGASRQTLARYGLEARVAELNASATQLAQEARAQAERPVLIAGSVGPTPSPDFRTRLSPYEIREALREQIEALLDGGVDLIIFETFGDLHEMVEAVNAARSVTATPIVAQMAFSGDGRTLAGDTPTTVASTLEQLGVAVIGANCTQGPQGLLDVLRQLGQQTGLPLSAQPNAGLLAPTADGSFHYPADGPYLARYAQRFVEVGAGVVGGCCGTTPAHIAEIVRAVRGMPPSSRALRAPTASAQSAEASTPNTTNRLAEKLAADQFVVACEIQSTPGHDAEQVVQDGRHLHDAGIDVVNIAVGNSPRAHLSSVAVALLLQQQANIQAIVTATSWGKTAVSLQADLLGAHALGIRNMICRTGTPPHQGVHPSIAGIRELDANGLIRLVRSLNEGRDYNGMPIGTQTSFFVGARINPTADDRDHELQVTWQRIQAGADFLLTTPVFDLDALDELLEELGPSQVPILMQVMPLQSFDHAEYLQHEIPGMSLPEWTVHRMREAGAEAPQVGFAIARDLVLAAQERVKGVVLASATGSAVEVEQLLRTLPG